MKQQTNVECWCPAKLIWPAGSTCSSQIREIPVFPRRKTLVVKNKGLSEVVSLVGSSNMVSVIVN